MAQQAPSERMDSSRRTKGVDWMIPPTPQHVWIRSWPEHQEGLLPAGARVQRGQRLVSRTSHLHPTPLASVTGKIAEIDGHWIKLEAEEDETNEREKLLAGFTLNPETVAGKLGSVGPAELPMWIDRAIQRSLSAVRPASPDLLAQLRAAVRGTVDTVLCSALDSDPQLPFASCAAATAFREIAAGVRLLGKLTGAGKLVVVVESSDEIVTKNDRWASSMDIRVTRLVNDFPQADPTLLLYELLNRKLRPRKLPTEQGVLLLDAPAAWMLGRIVMADASILELPVAVRDHRTRRNYHAIVPRGMRVGDLLLALGINRTDVALIAGDLLRQRDATMDLPISTEEQTIHLVPARSKANPDPCVRCGWCNDACPTRISPVGILDAAQSFDHKRAEHYGLTSCIECGICTYVCPSRLPILRAIRSLGNG